MIAVECNRLSIGKTVQSADTMTIDIRSASGGRDSFGPRQPWTLPHRSRASAPAVAARGPVRLVDQRGASIRPPTSPIRLLARKQPAIARVTTLGSEAFERPACAHEKRFHVGLEDNKRGCVVELQRAISLGADDVE